MLDTWMPGVVVISLFYTYFTPIQAVIVVEGQTDCYDTLYYPMRSNTQRADFLAFAVKVNRYGSSVLHWIEPRLVQMNSSLHGSFKFNKFYQRKFQHLYTHVLRSERANTVSILQIRKRIRKKSAGKSNQQGLETSYQMSKGPKLHHAQQSLTKLRQSSTKVNTDMHVNN